MRSLAPLTFAALAALPFAPMLACGGGASHTDASADTTDDGIPCDHPNDLVCLDELGHQGSLVTCGDVSAAPVCVAGHLACPPGTIDVKQCTCSGLPTACAVCTSAGWGCDAGADAPADSPSDANADAATDSPSDTSAGCSFSATYLAYDDGGNRPYVEQTILMAPRTDWTDHVFQGSNDGSACPRELTCASAAQVTVPQIEAAVANADVQAALAQADGTLYGSDPRPVDGTVWVFKRNGHGFAVGSGIVPAGLTALETLLRQVTADAHASPECSTTSH